MWGKTKRILSLLLSLLFIFASCSISAFAETLNADMEVQPLSTSSGTLSDGMYLLESNYNGLTLKANGKTAGSSLSHGSYYYEEENIEIERLFKFIYLETVNGVEYYIIRPMTNNGLALTYSNGNITLETIGSVASASQRWAVVCYSGICHIYNNSTGTTKYLTASETATEGAAITVSNTEDDANGWAFFQIIDYDYTYRSVELTNYIGDFYAGDTYDFDYIAYSSSASQNEVVFSVTDVNGNSTTKATIDSSTGVFKALSPGEVVVRAKFPTSITVASWHITIHSAYSLSNTVADTTVDYDKTITRYICTSGSSLSAQILNEAEEMLWEFIEAEVEYDSEGNEYKYYIIQLRDSSKVLTAPRLIIDGDCCLLSYNSDLKDRQLWYFQSLADGYFQIQPKNYRTASCSCNNAGTCAVCIQACYLKTSSLESYANVIIGVADECSKWYRATTGTDIFMVGTSEWSHDHFTAFGNILQELDYLGYHNYNIVDIPDLDIIGNTDILRVQSGMAQAKVIVTHTHGANTNQYTYLYLSNANTNYAHNFYPYDLPDDLSNCDLAIFVGCYTAAEVPNPLPLAAVNAGADYAIGFKDEIVCAAANDWITFFLDNYSKNPEEGIEKAAQDALTKCYSLIADYNNAEININSMVIYSNPNNT